MSSNFKLGARYFNQVFFFFLVSLKTHIATHAPNAYWTNSRKTLNGLEIKHSMSCCISIVKRQLSNESSYPGETHQKLWTMIQRRTPRRRAVGTTHRPQANQQHCSPIKTEAPVLSVWTAALTRGQSPSMRSVYHMPNNLRDWWTVK